MATTLGAVAEGSIVYLNESGVAVPFYVAKHNYESALNGDGRTLLVRKDAYGKQVWDTGDVNTYSGSDIDNFFNNTYLNLLDSFVQEDASVGTTFYYCPGNGNNSITTLKRTVFALSITELGHAHEYAPVDGTQLGIRETLKIATNNGTAVMQWTRSPDIRSGQTERAWHLSNTGSYRSISANYGNSGTVAGGWSRPALTLRANIPIDDFGNVVETAPEPDTYTKLEYIESTGTQYINTKYNPTGNTRVKMDVQLTSSSGDPYIFGVWTSHLVNMCSVFFASATSTWTADYGTVRTDTGNATWNKRQIVDLNKNVLTVDGTVKTLSAMSFSQTYPMFLLAHNSAGTAAVHAKAKLYSCQIYDNGTLVRDFVPAKRNSDGAIGLLDQANNVFYANAGTGTFVAGPVAEYTWLEWIESSGTQWIDTGFVPNQDTRVVFDFEYTKAVSGAQQGVFGSRIALRNAMYLMWTENGNAGWRDGYGTELKYPIGSTISGRVVVDKNKNALSINGTVVYTATYATFNSTYSLYLLTTNNAGSPMIDSYPTYARIYACQIYDNGTLVRDLVPAKRSDGTVGLYDKVNDRFYTNSGTGAFTAGPEIVAARSLAMIDDTEYPLVQGYVRVNGISYPLLYALALIDDVEYTAPFGDAQQTISFYIETDNDSGVYEEYQAENGMTWAEWVESEYNTDGFYVKTYGNYTWIERIISNTAISVQDTSGDDVQPSDTIVSDYQYQAAWVI